MQVGNVLDFDSATDLSASIGPAAGRRNKATYKPVPPRNSIVSLTCPFRVRGWRGAGWLARCWSRSLVC
jgi:hypothetical protein